MWKATVNVKIDESEIQKWIKHDDNQKATIIGQVLDAKKAYEENERKIEDLKEKYTRATSQEKKDTILKQMNDADRDFLANQKF